MANEWLENYNLEEKSLKSDSWSK